ncbi:MAG: DUF4339 domain-containing protein, partial [Planctomycetaceae bacterium]|nr:DUF4339 domain-containing protein [Planctomycetaceae bacterium]
MATAWYMRRNQKVVGPLSGKQLKELALAGKLQGDDLVRKGNESDFVPANQIKQLFIADDSTSRPSPPPPRLGERLDGSSGVPATPNFPKKWVVVGACVLGVMVIGGIFLTVTQTKAARKEIAEAAKLWKKGEHAEAVAIYQTVIKKRGPFIPDEQEPLVYGRVIDHLVQEGREQEARQILEKLNSSSSSSSVTPLVESEAGRQLLADIRREQQRKESEKRKHDEQKALAKASKNQNPKADTFMAQLAQMGGLPEDTPLPRRFFDRNSGHFNVPRYCRRPIDRNWKYEFSYEDWVKAFGEPTNVRTSPHNNPGMGHVWQHNYNGKIVYVSGCLKTSIHWKPLIEVDRLAPGTNPRQSWTVIVH